MKSSKITNIEPISDGPIGLIGLGNAGSALAGPLSARYTVNGFDIRSEQRPAAEAAGVQWMDSVREIAESCTLVLINLPSPDASREVTQQILAANIRPDFIVETSTVTPALAQELHASCVANNVRFVDAAIAGGVAGMAAGKTSFLVGGASQDFEAVRPVLDAMAITIRHMGPVGAGMGAKVVINAIYHSLMVVLLEAGAMTRKLDISIDALVDILRSDEGLMRPLDHRLADRVPAHNFTGGMSIDNARKDSVLALETAQNLGVPLFSISASHTPYEIAQAKGMGELDYASLAVLWEEWCNVDFSSTSDSSA